MELAEPTLKQLFEAMILVEGGSVEMGSGAEGATKRVKPVHIVDISTFYMKRAEVAQKLYVVLMGWHTSYFQCAGCAMNNVSGFQV